VTRTRLIAFVAVAALAVAGFVRLGFWQLGRLAERRAANAAVQGRLEMPPADVADIAADTATARFRRTVVRGQWDYANELVLTSRSRQGSPGVHLITPLRPADGGVAVLVNRGWVYAADGMTVDLARWAERDSGVVEGFVETYTDFAGPVATPSAPRGVRRLTGDSVAARIPYPILPILVVQGDTATIPSQEHPVRVPPPTLDEGAHRSYAIQWFAFALITVIGTAAVLSRSRLRSVR
jgi:surfeit locus 1 family protein